MAIENCKVNYCYKRDFVFEIERLRVGLKMIAATEYEVGYDAETFAQAVLNGDEPQSDQVVGEHLSETEINKLTTTQSSGQ